MIAARCGGRGGGGRGGGVAREVGAGVARRGVRHKTENVARSAGKRWGVRGCPQSAPRHTVRAVPVAPPFEDTGWEEGGGGGVDGLLRRRRRRRRRRGRPRFLPRAATPLAARDRATGAAERCLDGGAATVLVATRPADRGAATQAAPSRPAHDPARSSCENVWYRAGIFP